LFPNIYLGAGYAVIVLEIEMLKVGVKLGIIQRFESLTMPFVSSCIKAFPRSRL